MNTFIFDLWYSLLKESMRLKLQKKLDTYHRRLREVETNGVVARGRGLRDFGGNLRDFSGGVVGNIKGGLSGLHQKTQNAAGAIVGKPKDIAIKFKNKFGSVDNLANYKEDGEDAEVGSGDDISSTSESYENGLGGGTKSQNEYNNSNTSPESTLDNRTQGGNPTMETKQLEIVATQLLSLKADIEEVRHKQSNSETKWNAWQAKMKEEMDLLKESIREERSWNERLETQLHEITEFQQRQFRELKQDLTYMEEKVEYHANERARDMQELVERCQTRLTKVEIQQQQAPSHEALDNITARQIFGKLINLLMSVLALLLVFVSTISGMLQPFTRSPNRVIITLCVTLVAVFFYKHWESLSNWNSNT